MAARRLVAQVNPNNRLCSMLHALCLVPLATLCVMLSLMLCCPARALGYTKSQANIWSSYAYSLTRGDRKNVQARPHLRHDPYVASYSVLSSWKKCYRIWEQMKSPHTVPQPRPHPSPTVRVESCLLKATLAERSTGGRQARTD